MYVCVLRSNRNNYLFFHHPFTAVLCRYAQQAGTALHPSPLMKYQHGGGRFKAFHNLYTLTV